MSLECFTIALEKWGPAGLRGRRRGRDVSVSCFVSFLCLVVFALPYRPPGVCRRSLLSFVYFLPGFVCCSLPLCVSRNHGSDLFDCLHQYFFAFSCLSKSWLPPFLHALPPYLIRIGMCVSVVAAAPLYTEPYCFSQIRMNEGYIV